MRPPGSGERAVCHRSSQTRPSELRCCGRGRGRPLPVWQGCRTLGTGELLLLNPDHPDSLDGRYFGPLPASAVIGRATPLHLRAPAAPPSPPSEKEIGHADQYL